jgi:hypothetical protein
VTEVHIGSEEVEKFLVRKDLATRHSKVIEKALDPESDWKEAAENNVRLPEETPEAFQAFLTFLDTGAVHLGHFRSASEEDANQETSDETAQWESIAGAWLLGDRILSVSFKDAIVDKVIHMVRDLNQVPTALHRDIYKGSAFGSGMRTLLVDIATYSWFSGTLADQPGDPECAEFFRDVGVQAMRRRTLQSEALATALYDQKDVGCHYHDHKAEGKPCYKTMFG